MTVVIHSSFSPSKTAEIKQALGENHQHGTFIGSDYCVEFLNRAEADLAVANLNVIQGVRAEIVR